MLTTPHAPKVRRKDWPEWEGNTAIRPVQVGKVAVGGERPVIIAGPCAVESLAQTIEIALAVRDAGGDMLRGGAFKPRTNPYSFQGLGERGLEILAEARERTGLPVVSEVMDTRMVETVAQYVDVLQIGSRSMQNMPLLIAAGESRRPVLLKRAWSATLDEWLCSAEYIASRGNLDVILCERGIRTFTLDEYSRNTLDLNVVPALREITFLPVIVDPSHATGRADRVPSASLAALAVGADGLLIEVIGDDTRREAIQCDADQGVRPDVLRSIVTECHRHFGQPIAWPSAR
jgi:3-deoxy-7-phosphoheptulonate synthase